MPRRSTAASLGAFVLFVTAVLTPAQEWPARITSQPSDRQFRVLSSQAEYYQSRSFHLVSFPQHDDAAFREFVGLIESVPRALKALPLPLFAPPERGRIRILPDTASYRAAGGPLRTVGFYHRRRQQLLINWPHFRVHREAGSLIPRAAHELAIHEITHFCMHDWMGLAPQWFLEGMAEYLVAAHQGQGDYDFTKIEAGIRRRVRAMNPPKSKNAICLPLSQLATMTGRDWLRHTAEADPWAAFDPYQSSLLLVHYVCHGGAKRREQLKTHLEALKNRHSVPALLSNESLAQIEKSLVTFWKQRGLRVAFQARPE